MPPKIKNARPWLRWALGLGCAAGTLLAYMLWEYRDVRVRTLEVFADDSALKGMKIIYVADFQYDLSNRDNGLQTELFAAAVDLINAQQPDLILLGGDYLNYAVHRWEVAQQLARLEAPLGVYGVFGNHDTRAQKDLIQALAGRVTFLENDALLLTTDRGTLALTGVEDLWRGKPTVEGLTLDGGADYSILLTHNPDFVEQLTEEERGRFDLALAGHTHAGQITLLGQRGVSPVIDHVTDFGETYRYGPVDAQGLSVYVTSGLGGPPMAGLPLRFFAPPEIVVLV